jgi:hypothetical protein
MKKLALIAVSTLLLFGFVSAEPLLGTKKPFFDSIFCKFYLCNLIERKLITSSIEQFDYAVTRDESDYLASITDVWVVRTNGVLTGGGMSTSVQDNFFVSGRNAFIQRFVESLTGARVNDDQLDQLQYLADQSAREANRLGKTMNEVSISVGPVGKKMKLLFRLFPRDNSFDAQLRVSM